MKSVGRGANLLLNVPPDTRGLINEKDSAALMGFKKLRDNSFRNNLLSKPGVKIRNTNTHNQTSKLTDGKSSTFEVLSAASGGSKIMIQLNKPTTINTIQLQEPIQLGQRIIKFRVLLQDKNGVILKEVPGTTIGRKRILSFPAVTASSIQVIIDDAKAIPLISEVAAYHIAEELIEK